MLTTRVITRSWPLVHTLILSKTTKMHAWSRMAEISQSFNSENRDIGCIIQQLTKIVWQINWLYLSLYSCFYRNTKHVQVCLKHVSSINQSIECITLWMIYYAISRRSILVVFTMYVGLFTCNNHSTSTEE